MNEIPFHKYKVIGSALFTFIFTMQVGIEYQLCQLHNSPVLGSQDEQVSSIGTFNPNYADKNSFKWYSSYWLSCRSSLTESRNAASTSYQTLGPMQGDSLTHGLQSWQECYQVGWHSNIFYLWDFSFIFNYRVINLIDNTWHEAGRAYPSKIQFYCFVRDRLETHFNYRPITF